MWSEKKYSRGETAAVIVATPPAQGAIVLGRAVEPFFSPFPPQPGLTQPDRGRVKTRTG